MNQIIVAWTKSGEDIFEQHVPLLFNGQRNGRLGSANHFHVLFLEGLDLLSVRYKDELASFGYVVHDAAQSYRPLERKYISLQRFGDYERKCFLRWLVIRDVFGDIPFIHYDADVVFNATPEELESAFMGLTFMLQGCPAFCFISDRGWLQRYAEEFDIFFQDMEGYSDDAWRHREALVPKYKERNGNLWERQLISSDQDLLQFLTMSARLPQADASTVNSRSNFALFQNPLTIGRDIHLPLPLKYHRSGYSDYLGGRKVAIWHMQSAFCDYLGYASYRRQVGRRSRIPLLEGKWSLNRLGYRFFRSRLSLFNRLWLLNRFFSGAKDLAFLFNDDCYWQEGVFA